MKHAALIALIVLTRSMTLAFGAPSATSETVTELSAALDADGDGLLDLIIVDKSTGVRQLAFQQGDGSFTWLDPAPTGVDQVTSLATGRFQSAPAHDGFAIAAPSWNQVQVASDVAGDAVTVPSTGIGPNLVVAFDFAGDALDDLVVATEWDNPPAATHLVGEQNAPGAWTSVTTSAEPGPLALGNRARFKSDRTWILGAMRPSTTGREFITRQFFPGAGLTQGPTLTGLSAQTAWAWGEFTPGGYSQFLFYTPGTSALQAPGLTEPAPQTFAWTPGQVFDFGLPITQVTVLPSTNSAMLLLVFGDGSTAATYTFDGVNPPKQNQTFTAPASMKFSSASPLAGGDFALLHGAQGGQGNSTGWQRWRWNGQQHQLAASGTIPAIPASINRANVLVFSDDPDLVSAAALVRRLRAGDWSDTARVVGTGVQVTREVDRNSQLGLGGAGAVTLNLGGAPLSVAFPSVNQRSLNESVAWLSSSGVQPLNDLAFAPPAGTYHLAAGQPLAIRIDAPGATAVYVRSDATQPWALYDPATPPALSASATLMAFAVGMGPGPIRTAAYTIAGAPAVVPASPTDANHNGLPDAWEQAFGLTDPNGDADGDGATNLQEYRAGTDPWDPQSVPSGGGLGSVELQVRFPGAGAPATATCEMSWPASVSGATLEMTGDLGSPGSWTPVMGPITTVGGEFIYYHVPNLGEAARFFRLHQTGP